MEAGTQTEEKEGDLKKLNVSATRSAQSGREAVYALATQFEVCDALCREASESVDSERRRDAETSPASDLPAAIPRAGARHGLAAPHDACGYALPEALLLPVAAAQGRGGLPCGAGRERAAAEAAARGDAGAVVGCGGGPGLSAGDGAARVGQLAGDLRGCGAVFPCEGRGVHGASGGGGGDGGGGT